MSYYYYSYDFQFTLPKCVGLLLLSFAFVLRRVGDINHPAQNVNE